MTNFTTFFVFPLAVVIAGLLIEYLIIQPLKNRANYPKNQNSQFEKTDFASLITRLLVGLSRISINHVGASFIERFGSFLASLPITILSIFVTFVSFIVAIPFFITLYYSEKFGGCRYEPTCKSYMVGAIENHGVTKGLYLALTRVLMCNPFSKGGHDPIPPRDISITQNRKSLMSNLDFSKKSVLSAIEIALFMVFSLIIIIETMKKIAPLISDYISLYSTGILYQVLILIAGFMLWMSVSAFWAYVNIKIYTKGSRLKKIIIYLFGLILLYVITKV